MKRKFLTPALSLLLALGLLAPAILPVQAKEAEEAPEAETEQTPQRELHIDSLDRFLHFAEQCRLDGYSRNLTVFLDCDLDLSGTDFRGIPIFCGTLEGNKHSISGFTYTEDGSNQGLFRYLTETAEVKNLTVEGTLTPSGSQSCIGGIAGVNQGSLTGCRFKGTVSGGDIIGGLVGSNRITGTIQDCMVLGDFNGTHFVGGIAGENYGVIKNCANRGRVNTVAQESKVHVASISLETITGTESASTVTDIGGITGTNIGVIRDCRNQGTVGYRHIGYNVGGIAGSHTGLIMDCQNYGKIYGRKETGGIAGQFEPVTQIEYTIDTLQILDQQLASAAGSLNQASYNAQTNLGPVGQGIEDMRYHAEVAGEALKTMTDGQIEDPDSYLAAANALGQSVHAMNSTMGSIGEAAQNTVGQLSQDLKNVSGQLSAMSQTIRDANEHMGIKLSDLSDQDTEDNLTGKIQFCENLGNVDADLNAGGICGAIAFENDMDPEDDLKELGDRSLNFEGSVRAVIRDCTNRAGVSAKKIHAGGIVGYMSAGLVRQCINTGIIDAEKAQYVGGIAGSSRGYIRACSVKCGLKAASCAGGIAGSGTIVSDCRSMVTIRKASEKTGAILGTLEPSQDEEVTQPVVGNIYMSLSQDLGAIDGISFQGKAEPMPPEKFRQQPDLPEEFQNTTLIFEGENNVRTRLVLPTGSVLRTVDIPPVPKKEGFTGSWENIQHFEGKRIYFDSTIQPVYTPHRITICSPQQRSNGRPVMLAEGVFPDISQIDLKALENPVLEGRKILETWELPFFSNEETTVLHLNLPEDTGPERLALLVRREDGSWQEISHTVNARYLVFEAAPGDTAVCVELLPDRSWIRPLVLTAAGAAVLIPILILKKKKKAK